MAGKLFSKRTAPPIDHLTYDIPENARTRILHCLAQLCHQFEHPGAYFARGNFPGLLEDVYKRCLREYGHTLLRKGRDNPREIADRAAEHFLASDAAGVIDFLEMLFQSREYSLGQDGVDAVNEVFRDMGIGFEFTPLVRRDIAIQVDSQGFQSFRVEIDYPEAIKKTSDQMHVTVIVPALTLLSDPKWKTANDEMLDAHRAFREARLDDANTACGRAFETIFKTICTAKGWPYDPNKDTLAKLVDICRDNNLFLPFYAEIFKSSGTVRNKLGGHGKGPTPLYQNDEAYVAHMLQITSAHILLLAALAKI